MDPRSRRLARDRPHRGPLEELHLEAPFASGCAGLFGGGKCQEGGAELPTSLDDISHLGTKIALFPPALVDPRLNQERTVRALR